MENLESTDVLLTSGERECPLSSLNRITIFITEQRLELSTLSSPRFSLEEMQFQLIEGVPYDLAGSRRSLALNILYVPNFEMLVLVSFMLDINGYIGDALLAEY